MKICILTQPLHTNYGGILQAYALQRTLRKMGHEAVTARGGVTRKRSKHRSLYFIYYAFKRYVCRDKRFNPYRFMFSRLGRDIEKQESYASQDITHFVNLRIRFSELFLAPRTMATNYDALVVGSDQVWRAGYSDPATYFLDFAKGLNIKRYAYAASFGLSTLDGYSEQTIDECRELAQLFDAITVREKSGVDICRNKLGVNASQVCDPTMLLTREEWSAVAGEHEAEPSLVSYILDKSDEKRQIIELMEQHTSLKVNSLTPRKWLHERWHDIEQCRFKSIEEWLRSMRSARFVVTDSFHGTLFAILFERDFVVVDNAERGSDRLTSLLEPLGLMDRMIADHNKLSNKILNSHIDYTRVTPLVDNQRKKAMEWLAQNMK